MEQSRDRILGRYGLQGDRRTKAKPNGIVVAPVHMEPTTVMPVTKKAA